MFVPRKVAMYIFEVWGSKRPVRPGNHNSFLVQLASLRIESQARGKTIESMNTTMGVCYVLFIAV